MVNQIMLIDPNFEICKWPSSQPASLGPMVQIQILGTKTKFSFLWLMRESLCNIRLFTEKLGNDWDWAILYFLVSNHIRESSFLSPS